MHVVVYIWFIIYNLCVRFAFTSCPSFVFTRFFFFKIQDVLLNVWSPVFLKMRPREYIFMSTFNQLLLILSIWLMCTLIVFRIYSLCCCLIYYFFFLLCRKSGESLFRKYYYNCKSKGLNNSPLFMWVPRMFKHLRFENRVNIVYFYYFVIKPVFLKKQT